jgi:hypothetical protein
MATVLTKELLLQTTFDSLSPAQRAITEATNDGVTVSLRIIQLTYDFNFT